MFSQNRGASDESGESAGTTGECRAIMFLQISHLFGFIMGSGERGKKRKTLWDVLQFPANRRSAALQDDLRYY